MDDLVIKEKYLIRVVKLTKVHFSPSRPNPSLKNLRSPKIKSTF